LLTNIVVFISVMCSISGDLGSKWTTIKAAVTFSVTLSLYYIFGAFTVAFPDEIVFDYLGAITMIVQGGLIFYFHCLGKPDVRHALFSRTRRLTLFTPSSRGGGGGKARSQPTDGKHDKTPDSGTGSSGGGIAYNGRHVGKPQEKNPRTKERKYTDFGEDRSSTAEFSSSTGQQSDGYYSVANTSVSNNSEASNDVVLDMRQASSQQFANTSDRSGSVVTARSSSASSSDGGVYTNEAARRLTDFSGPKKSARRPTPAYVPAPAFSSPTPTASSLVPVAEAAEFHKPITERRSSSLRLVPAESNDNSEFNSGPNETKPFFHDGGIATALENRDTARRLSSSSVGSAGSNKARRRSSLV